MSNYWKDRSKSRLLRSEQIGLNAANKVLPMYDLALKNINKEINSIYLNYSDKVGLDVSELTKILSGVDRHNFLKNIQAKMKSLGFNVTEIYDPNYIARLTRLEALKQQVYWEIQNIAPKEIDTTTNAYGQIIIEGYNTSREDIRDQLGNSTAFATINRGAVKDILSEKWEGGNYSSRIWVHTSQLASQLQTVLGAGLTIGTSQEKMARMINERFDVGKYNAMRLIRTETNYFQNQAELESYKDEGINYYEYDSIMDGRTSLICQGLDKKIFKVEEAEAGVNYPPMHPNCRSGTRLIFDAEVIEKKVWAKEESSSVDPFQEVYETQMKGLREEVLRK